MQWTENKIPPVIGPFEGEGGLTTIISSFCIESFRVLQDRFSAVSRGPGGFREVWKAFTKHFYLYPGDEV